MTKEEIIKIQISRVEKEIRDTPYDKASEHHHGRLKAKLSKLKDDLYGVSTGGGGGGLSYAIRHSGDATAVLVGLPSVGKSTLLNKLTNAESKVGNYDFTTLGVVPGMMNYKGVRVQILDLPGIVEGASKNKGFGKKVLSVIRASNMVILISDVDRLNWFSKMEMELYASGIRYNGLRPKIDVRKSDRGSIRVVNPYGGLSTETVVDVCKEMGISNAVVNFGEKITDVDKLIDVLTKSRVYLPLIRVVSKVDGLSQDKKNEVLKFASQNDCVMLSAIDGFGIDKFKEMIWEKLGLVRVYLKRDRSRPADKVEPLIIGSNKTLASVVEKISNEMGEDVKSAYIWGNKARFAGQKVSFNYPVFDEMEVWFGR